MHDSSCYKIKIDSPHLSYTFWSSFPLIHSMFVFHVDPNFWTIWISLQILMYYLSLLKSWPFNWKRSETWIKKVPRLTVDVFRESWNQLLLFEFRLLQRIQQRQWSKSTSCSHSHLFWFGWLPLFEINSFQKELACASSKKTQILKLHIILSH